MFHRREPRMAHDRPAMLIFAGAALVQLANWAYFAWLVKPQDGLLFVHYNIYFGVDLVGPWYRLYTIPAAGLVVLLVNFFLARTLHRKSPILSRLLLAITAYAELLILLVSLLIIRQNSV